MPGTKTRACGLRLCLRGRAGHTIIPYDVFPESFCRDCLYATAILFSV